MSFWGTSNNAACMFLGWMLKDPNQYSFFFLHYLILFYFLQDQQKEFLFNLLVFFNAHVFQLHFYEFDP